MLEHIAYNVVTDLRAQDGNDIGHKLPQLLALGHRRSDENLLHENYISNQRGTMINPKAWHSSFAETSPALQKKAEYITLLLNLTTTNLSLFTYIVSTCTITLKLPH